MRRGLFYFVVLVTVATFAAANSSDTVPSFLTNGELAVLLLETAHPEIEAPSPTVALREVQDMGLMPVQWRSGSVVTQGTFAEVMSQFGVSYDVTRVAEPVTDALVQPYLSRSSRQVQDMMIERTESLVPPHSVFDEGRPRTISRSTFE